MVVIAAAAATLSLEEVLPKGGGSKAEELEDELEDDNDITFTMNLCAESVWSLFKCPEARNSIYIHIPERRGKLLQKNCRLPSMMECQAFRQNLCCVI